MNYKKIDVAPVIAGTENSLWNIFFNYGLRKEYEFYRIKISEYLTINLNTIIIAVNVVAVVKFLEYKKKIWRDGKIGRR